MQSKAIKPQHWGYFANDNGAKGTAVRASTSGSIAQPLYWSDSKSLDRNNMRRKTPTCTLGVRHFWIFTPQKWLPRTWQCTKHLLLLLVSQVECGTNASDNRHWPSASRKNALFGQSPLYACLVNLIYSYFVLHITVCVNGDLQFLWEWANFHHHEIDTPELINKKSAQLITSGRGPYRPNLVQIYRLRASGQMGEI